MCELSTFLNISHFPVPASDVTDVIVASIQAKPSVDVIELLNSESDDEVVKLTEHKITDQE